MALPRTVYQTGPGGTLDVDRESVAPLDVSLHRRRRGEHGSRAAPSPPEAVSS